MPDPAHDQIIAEAVARASNSRMMFGREVGAVQLRVEPIVGKVYSVGRIRHDRGAVELTIGSGGITPTSVGSGELFLSPTAARAIAGALSMAAEQIERGQHG